jgi:hypothetical protein
MNWETQINNICKSLTNKLSLLRKIKNYLPHESRIIYYNAYILPIMDYCDTIWGNTTQYNINRVIKLQKQAARIILNKTYETPSSELFNELKWLKFHDRITFHKAVLVYKSLNNLSPQYLSSLFVQNETEYNLRSITNGDLLVPKFKLQSYKFSLNYSGANIWNSIPINIKKASSLKEF